MCGISDVLDGYLARRYKLETKLGEKLDSLGDAVFCGAILYLLAVHTDILKAWVLIGIAIVVVFRVANFLITRVRFQTWGVMHTWGNKATGILLYLYLPAALIHNTISLVPGLGLCLIALASAIEEMVVLFTSKQYHANRKSVFIR